MNLVPNKQLLVNAPFQSSKYRKKEFCLDNKVQEAIGDVDCPTCPNEKCVHSSTNKTSSFHDCKMCKACSNVLNIPSKDQKPTIMLFSGDGKHCFARKTGRDYEKRKPTLFWKKLLYQSQSCTPTPEPKKGKNHSIYGIVVTTPHRLIVNQKFNSILILYFQSTVKQHDFLSLQRRY